MFKNLKREIEKDFDKENNYANIMNKVKETSKIKKLEVLCCAATACLVFVTIISANLLSANNVNEVGNALENNQISSISAEHHELSDFDVTVDPSRDKSEVFDILNYEDRQYTGQKSTSREENIGEYLGEYVLTTYNYATDSEYSQNTKVYSINEFSKDYFVAVRFNNDENYYVYQNTSYSADEIEKFVQDFQLREKADFGEIVTKIGSTMNKYYNVDNDIILKLLFSNESISENINLLEEYQDATISIKVNIPELGYKDRVIGIESNGYISTNLYEKGKIFVGEDRFKAFLSYLTTEYNGNKSTLGGENNNEGGTVTITLTGDSSIVSDFKTKEDMEELNKEYQNVTKGYIPNNSKNYNKSPYIDASTGNIVYPE